MRARTEARDAIVVADDVHVVGAVAVGFDFGDGWRIDGEAHGRAVALAALDHDLSAQQVHQVATDGKTQTRAAVLPADGRVGLLKAVEQLRLLDFAHADTRVRDRYLELIVVARMHGDGNFAGVGELDGIVHEITEYLLEARRIARETVRCISPDVNVEVQIFAAQMLAVEHVDVIEQFEQVHLDDFEFHATGFRFRKIQHVIEDTHQRFAGAA